MLSRLSPIHRIAIARAVSVGGTEAAFVALVALVYQTTGSGLWVAAVLGTWIGVEGLVAPLAGALGDRFDRQVVMVVADLAAALVFAAMAFVTHPAALVGLAALAAAAEAPFPSASSAAIPNLVDPSRIAWANGTIAATRTVGNLAGPLVGGGMVAFAGASSVFVLNAISFALSAALVWSIRGARFREPTRAAKRRRGLLAGLHIVWGDPTLRGLAAAGTILHLGIGGVLVSELPLVESFGYGPIAYGLLVAMWAGGALIGSLWGRSLGAHPNLLRIIALGAGGSAVGLGLVGSSPWISLAIVAQLAGGIGNGVANVSEEILIQRSTPDEVRSRVIGLIQALQMTALGVSLGLAGLALGVLSPQALYLVAGGLGLAAVVVVVRIPRAAENVDVQARAV